MSSHQRPPRTSDALTRPLEQLRSDLTKATEPSEVAQLELEIRTLQRHLETEEFARRKRMEARFDLWIELELKRALSDRRPMGQSFNEAGGEEPSLPPAPPTGWVSDGGTRHRLTPPHAQSAQIGKARTLSSRRKARGPV
jgi:hypothetical protein